MQYLVLLLIEIEPSYLLVRSICILFHMVLFLFFNCCSLVSYFALTTSWSMDRRVITSICGRAHRARQDTEQSRARHRTRQDTEQGRTQNRAGHRAGQDTENALGHPLQPDHHSSLGHILPLDHIKYGQQSEADAAHLSLNLPFTEIQFMHK